jgi:hypothetical protein
MDEQTVRAVLQHYLDNGAAGREEVAHEIYAEDAVLEFPQSGERFEGVAQFLPWRAQYPAKVRYELGRVRGGDDVWVAELTVSYDGGTPMFGVDVLEFTGSKVSRETIYVSEGFPAPDWRAPWRAAP